MVRQFLLFTLLCGGAVAAMVHAQDGPARGNRTTRHAAQDAASRTRQAPADSLPSVLVRRGSSRPASIVPAAGQMGDTTARSQYSQPQQPPAEFPVEDAAEYPSEYPAELPAVESPEEPAEIGSAIMPAELSDEVAEEVTAELPRTLAPATARVEDLEEEQVEAVDVGADGYADRAAATPGRPSTSQESREYANSLPPVTARAPRGAPPVSIGAPAGQLHVGSRLPALRIEAVGPTAVVVGKPAAYRVTLFNDGTEAGRDVQVRLQVPATVDVREMKATAGNVQREQGTEVVWTVAQLAGGADEQLALEIVAKDERPVELAMNWSARPERAVANIQVQKPQLLVAITGPKDIQYGARQVYTITISNPGTGPAENAVLDVATGGGSQSKQLGTIAAGGQQQVRMELVAREAGQLDIQAVATADGLSHQAEHTILVRRAELAVEVTGPRLQFAGSRGIYEVRVTNTGNAPATEVSMSLRKPSTLKYAGGVDDAEELAGRVAWVIDNIAPQQELTYRLEMEFTDAGVTLCEAVASAAGDLTASGSCETQVEAIADLKLVINDPQSPKIVGDEVTYEVRVTNRGTKASGQVRVTGQFGEGIEPVRAAGAVAELIPGQVLFQPIPQIAAGQTVTLTIVARADKAGNHRFRAVMQADEPETELIAEDTTRYFGDEAKSAPRLSRQPTKTRVK